MRVRVGSKYQSLAPEIGCVCQSPLVEQFQRRIADGLSRRSVLKIIGGAIAGASLAGVGRALAAVPAAPRQSILLTDCRIFDGVSASLIEGRNILISGQKIEALVPVADVVTEAHVVKCGGNVVIPGLIDAHAHTLMSAISQVEAMTADVPYVHLVAAQEAERTLLRGFTTVRDVGGPSFALKRSIDENRFAGPRIFPSGAMISQTSGHGDFRMRSELPRGNHSGFSAIEAAGISAIADGEHEVLRRVREQLMLGASQIKIMAGGGVSSVFDPLDSLQFTEREIRAAVDAASDWGTYVCAHVYTSKAIRRAVANGVRSIEHGQLADEDDARLMADEGVWWSLQPFLADEDANPARTKESREKQKMVSEGTVRAYGFARKHNVNVAWGTDILFSPDATVKQGRHLAKIARWYDPVDVLRMATSRNGELLAMSGERNPYRAPLGVIKAGAWADLLVVAGNPLENISLVAEPDTSFKLIMKDGRVYKNAL